jgi:CarD family transcriptional regulator
VIEIKERHTLGPGKRYYSLELLDQPETVVMVPVGAEERLGLRHTVTEAKLGRVWRILESDPNSLPKNYDKRCALVDEKLGSGELVQIAEAVRDMAWQRKRRQRLTIEGRRLYQRGMALLAGEVASVQNSGLADAESLIATVLDKNLQALGQA